MKALQEGSPSGGHREQLASVVDAVRDESFTATFSATGTVMDGIQATAQVRQRWPEIPVLVLTTFDDDGSLFGALRAGAAGYLLKDVSSETLLSAITAAARGEAFLQSTVTGRVVAAFAKMLEPGGARAAALVLPLSPREREILGLLGTGASNKEIADRLCLAEGTVKNHVTNVLTKVDVRDRTQAALRARELGIARSSSPNPRPTVHSSTRTRPFGLHLPILNK